MNRFEPKLHPSISMKNKKETSKKYVSFFDENLGEA
jgi:hypothetical protein